MGCVLQELQLGGNALGAVGAAYLARFGLGRNRGRLAILEVPLLILFIYPELQRQPRGKRRILQGWVWVHIQAAHNCVGDEGATGVYTQVYRMYSTYTVFVW